MTTEEGSKEEENDILKRIRMMFSKLQTTSSRIDKLRLESAEYSSQIDKSRLESAEEIEEIRTTEKQKVKECERQEMTEQDAELVNQEVNNETINNVVAGNDEPFVEVLMPGKTLNNIENEIEDLEIKEIVKDKCEEDKTCKEDAHLEKGFGYNNTENFASENDELNKEIPMENLETHDDNKEEAVTEEEGLEKEDQNEDSSGIDDRIFHPEEDIIERDDENQKEKLDTQDTNEPFQNHDQIQAEQKVNGRTGLEDLRIEFDKGKLASCADTYSRRETDKERNMNWSEEDGLKKIMLLNYTERGKQLRNSRN